MPKTTTVIIGKMTDSEIQEWNTVIFEYAKEKGLMIKSRRQFLDLVIQDMKKKYGISE